MKTAAVLTILSIVSFSGIGCAMSSQAIQEDTSIAVNLGLNAAVVLEPQEKANITIDATKLAGAVNAIIPQFFPNANAGQLASTVASQTMALLGAKMNATPSGQKIMGIIGLIELPISGLLGTTASPSALLSPTTKANLLAFLSGISQGVATFTGNSALNPPVPPPPPPPAPPAPATSPPSQ
jgi:hypothetical protein